MLIVAVTFATIFLFRDVQVLAVQDHTALPGRLGVYAALVGFGMTALFISTGALPGWTNRRFALGAIAVQLLELLIAYLFRRPRFDRQSWIGYILPSPGFLVALYALSLAIQDRFHAVNTVSDLEIVTVAWLLIVAGLTSALCRMKNLGEDRKFVRDFAMVTSCTALIFLPFGLS